MRIYLARLTYPILIAYRKIRPDAEINVLLSFAQQGQGNWPLMKETHSNSVVLDSGAYTYSQDAQHNHLNTMEAYKLYLKSYAHYFDFYFTYDHDFSRDSFETNRECQLELEEAGFTPVPVIHNCQNAEEMAYYTSSDYDLVAIGSSEIRDAPTAQLHQIVQGIAQKGIKVHLLGCTKYETLAGSGASSCDSTTWAQMATRGVVLYWNPHKVGQDKTDKIFCLDSPDHRRKRNHYLKYRFANQFGMYLNNTLSLTVHDLVGPGRRERMNRFLVNIDYFTTIQNLL